MAPDQRDTFDSVAAEYNAVRPTYPDEVFDDLAGVVGGPGERVLEVGCGSGQATQGLLDRGWEVLAVDPGADLIDLARARVSGGVAFHVGRFEAFEPEPASFRLVASAQAWHWIDPAISFPKAAAALRPGGWLALFGHVPMPPEAHVLRLLEPLYRDLAPELWKPPPQAWYLPDGPIPALFDASGLFGAVTHRRFAWAEQATARAFVRQLRTRSDYNVIEPDRRERLLAEVERVLTPLGDLSLTNETHLFRGQVRSERQVP
jgi:SAM-dependent methyltransferase